jgi:thiamine kinase-like enzyme
MKCPKNYLIPTNNWLKPLAVFHESSNLIMESELTNEIKKENVIVKVTKFENNNNLLKTEEIYNIIKESKHIVKIYCFINCNENKINLTNEYKDILGFCTRDTINDDNIKINLEIMKKYKHSLNRYEKKCNLETVKIILKYLLNMQYELYYKYGFIHNDIHLGNILIEKTDDHVTNFISYDLDLPSEIINTIQVKISTKFNLYLTDFEYSLVLKKSLYPEIMTFLKDKSNIKKDNTLSRNLYNTFEACLELIEDDTLRYNLFKKYQDYGKDAYVELVRTRVLESQDFTKADIKEDIKPYYIKPISTYARGLSNEISFLDKSLGNAKNTCNDIYNYIFS